MFYLVAFVNIHCVRNEHIDFFKEQEYTNTHPVKYQSKTTSGANTSRNVWKTPLDPWERMIVKEANNILVYYEHIVWNLWTLKGTPGTLGPHFENHWSKIWNFNQIFGEAGHTFSDLRISEQDDAQDSAVDSRWDFGGLPAPIFHSLGTIPWFPSWAMTSSPAFSVQLRERMWLG